jgi:hypothetical protein
MLRLALDQNSPTPVLDAVSPFPPPDISLSHITRIDRRLSRLDDRALVFALTQLGYDGLVTLDLRMLDRPRELAAVITALGRGACGRRRAREARPRSQTQ